ncbi:MAG: tRNA uridine(34) 5-carboxymethylaminomethyl modification radical SAM/GNAT enzyme Elp3 [Thermoplasmata archaeon]|nr:tRNA uridine(34) 5-carboxymethylaminomethyl modification radical SAM/GNAT enzyme Elp3 [Thermoplasmata archaeon]
MRDLAEIARAVLDGVNPEDAKRAYCEENALGSLPSNADIIASAPDGLRDPVARALRKKPSRTLSGVAPIAVMTSPAPCPHGTCSYCPGGVGNGTPQSYTGREPAALRAAQNDYEPHRQVKARLDQYMAIGHPTDKVDLIIMGGTFTARESAYQESFVKGCLDAMNGASSTTLMAAQAANGTAPHRCIGLTVETRPDLFTGRRVEDAIRLGATRVELGVQALRDEILTGVGRGHTVADTVAATADARDAGLKVLYQMMPGLPGSSPSEDLEDFRLAFTDPRFMPDMVKIYPTLVVAGTALHGEWAAGRYSPLDDERAIELVAAIKRMTPPWVRIQRVQRDIPAPLIAAGVRRGNLRELAAGRLASTGERCRCIRCREAGRTDAIGVPGRGIPTLLMREYKAADGREIFLSREAGDVLHAYLRLRLRAGAPARVRELRVVGELVPLGRADRGIQHRGLGGSLLSEAERIATRDGFDRIAVTSGVGVREYFERRGYRLEGMYMVRDIAPVA